jgi:transposase InsO family protein
MGEGAGSRSRSESAEAIKKKEKVEIIALVGAHGQAYCELTQAERLGCLALTPASFLHIQRTTRERLRRESAIGDDDVKQTVEQIIEYPFLGGHKGSLKLQYDRKALIGETFYKEIKQQLRLEAEKELQRRREECELENNQYKRQYDKENPFEKIVPEGKHDVWAIDFVTFLLFGIYFRICVVYEVFSQAYLSIIPAEVASHKIAVEALMSACEYSGQRPKICLLSDNGGQFTCYGFEQVREKLDISGRQTPPGQPWHNGALESGNRDLKKVLYTIAFHDACRVIEISRRGADRQRLLNSLKNFCVKTQQVINEEIVRPKFKTTPMCVLKEQVFEKNQKRVRFVESKLAERKQRMEKIKKQGGAKRQQLEDKVKKAWKKMASQMSTNEIFAFSELLNERYHAVAV